MKGRLLSVAAAVVALALGAGCRPGPGKRCSGSSALCIDKTSALFCVGGIFTPMPCRGQKGCAVAGAVVECDESTAAAGDACNIDAAIACTADKKESLRCTDRRFVLDETCKGPGACRVEGADKIACDNDVADVGDPCHFAGDFACTSDRSLVMKCEGGKMTPWNTCRGPGRCRVFTAGKQDRVDYVCDDSIAEDGDACDTNGEEACALDRKGMFACIGGRFGGRRPCPGGCFHDERTDRYTCSDGGAAPRSPPPPPLVRRRGRSQVH